MLNIFKVQKHLSQTRGSTADFRTATTDGIRGVLQSENTFASVCQKISAINSKVYKSLEAGTTCPSLEHLWGLRAWYDYTVRANRPRLGCKTKTDIRLAYVAMDAPHRRDGAATALGSFAAFLAITARFPMQLVGPDQK